MKQCVYLLTKHIKYEGDEVIAAYSTEQSAEEARSKAEEDSRKIDQYYWVDVVELQP